MKPIPCLLAAVALVAAACGDAPSDSPNDAPIEAPKGAPTRVDAARAAPPTAPSAAETAAAAALHLRTLAVDDPGIGCRAFMLLVPSDWRHEGGVHWQMQYSNLASGKLRVFDPKSAAALELFPVVPGCWDANGTLPTGVNYMGNVAWPPPPDVLTYVRDLFVPGYRADRTNLRIGRATPLPEVARAVERATAEPGVTKTVSAGKVRLDYEENGRAIAEDVFVTIVAMRSPLVPSMTIWSLEHQYSFRAEAERLDALAPLLQTMASSLRIELEWYAGYTQVLELWRQGQMQSIRDAGEISRRISQNNDALIASLRSSWETRQSSQDRMSREFSEAIRGVETFEHPFDQREVQLPSDWSHAWVDSRGEYTFSNDAGFDPNVGATREWRRLTPLR